MIRRNNLASVRNLSCSFAFMVAFFGDASYAIAQIPGTFSATGSMTSPRLGHTALLLPNGKVFIDGGISS